MGTNASVRAAVQRLTPAKLDVRLPSTLIDLLLGVGERRLVKRGTILETEGEPCRAFYVVLSGQLTVYAMTGPEREIVVHIVLPSECLGEGVLSPGNRSASVRAEIDSEVLAVMPDVFVDMLRTHPELALFMVRKLAWVMRALTDRVRTLALSDVYGRVVRLMQEVAVMHDGKPLVAGLSQRELARRIGASRSMVNNVIRDLVDGGLVTVEREGIRILRPLPPKW